MEGVTLNGVLIVSSLLFLTGVAGVLTRKNILIVLMSIELMLKGANLAFVAFSPHHGGGDGHIFAGFVLGVAGAEAAFGISVVILVQSLFNICSGRRCSFC